MLTCTECSQHTHTINKHISGCVNESPSRQRRKHPCLGNFFFFLVKLFTKYLWTWMQRVLSYFVYIKFFLLMFWGVFGNKIIPVFFHVSAQEIMEIKAGWLSLPKMYLTKTTFSLVERVSNCRGGRVEDQPRGFIPSLELYLVTCHVNLQIIHYFLLIVT